MKGIRVIIGMIVLFLVSQEQVSAAVVGDRSADGQEPADTAWWDKPQEISEVVVVGYGTQQRQKLTGSVAGVSRDVLDNVVQPTAEALLAGSVAGVSVTQTGQPGAASAIRIRGAGSVSASNEPLYVIDGFIYYKEGGSLSTGENGTGIEGGVRT